MTKLAIQQWLGRIQWASIGWPITRSWLQPAWAWLQAVKKVGRPSAVVGTVAFMLQALFVLPSCLQDPFSLLSTTQGFSDAGADDTRATIGGWFGSAAAVDLLNEMFGGSQMTFHKHISGSSSWEPLKGE